MCQGIGVLASWLPIVRELGHCCCCDLVLARPGEQTAEETVERPGLDIMLVVDTSGSMKVTDYRREDERTCPVLTLQSW